MSDAPRPRAVLVGPPGAGKSTVGRLLADRLGIAFRDTDVDIEAETGTTVADVFIDRGEEYFRDLERSAVERALTEHNGVLALGGGAVIDGVTRERLRRHVVVHLDVSLSDAAARVGFNRDRPLLVGNVRAQLKDLLEERRPLYVEVATVTVSTDGRSAQEVADFVLLELAEIAAESS